MGLVTDYALPRMMIETEDTAIEAMQNEMGKEDLKNISRVSVSCGSNVKKPNKHVTQVL